MVCRRLWIRRWSRGRRSHRRCKTPILPLLGFAAAFISASANASAGDEQAFIDLFGGVWAGSGTISSIPLRVSCHATGHPSANRITIEGNCRLAIIGARIAADLTFDPVTGGYSGTYIGARVGPARVIGKRSGSVVNLAITWPTPVHGDTKARMIIENAGGGSLRLTIFDNVAPGGSEERTTDVVLLLD